MALAEAGPAIPTLESQESSLPQTTVAPGVDGVPAAPATDQNAAPPPTADQNAPPPATQAGTAGAGGGNGFASVTTLAAQYRAEFEQTFGGLRQRAVNLQQAAPQLISEAQAGIEPYKQEFINTVQAVGEVATPAPVVLGTLAWASILVLATAISTAISGVAFAPVIAAAIGRLGAVILAVAVIPAIGLWSIKQDLAANVDDTTIRFRLLLLAGIEGLSVGFILQNSWLASAPLAALIPAITAVTYPIVSEKFGNNRQLLLGGSVGTAVGITLTVGFLSGSVSFPFVLLTAAYGAITAVTLQYIYKDVTTESVPTYVYQLALLTGFVFANLGAHAILGMGPEAYSQYLQESRR